MTLLKPEQLTELKQTVDLAPRRYGPPALSEKELLRRSRKRRRAQELALKRLQWRHREEYRQLYQQACRDLGLKKDEA